MEDLRGLLVLKDRPYAIDRVSLAGHMGLVHAYWFREELLAFCKTAGIDCSEIEALDVLDVLFPHKDQDFDDDWEDPVLKIYEEAREADDRSPEERAKAERESGERFVRWARPFGRKIEVVPPPPPGPWDPRTSEDLIPAVDELQRVLRESEDQQHAEARLREAGAGDAEVAAFVNAEGFALLIRRGGSYKMPRKVIAELGPLLPQLIERCEAAGVGTQDIQSVVDWLNKR